MGHNGLKYFDKEQFIMHLLTFLLIFNVIFLHFLTVSTKGPPKEMATKMKKLKVEMSTTQEPHEKDYVDDKLFQEDEEIKIGVGKILTTQLVEILSDRAFHIYG